MSFSPGYERNVRRTESPNSVNIKEGRRMWRHILGWFLMLVWAGYGVAHFIYVDETIRQVPAFIPHKRFIVIFTGALELLAAVLLAMPATQPYGAWGTMALLLLFIPSILHMTINDVFPNRWSPTCRVVVRMFAIPH